MRTGRGTGRLAFAFVALLALALVVAPSADAKKKKKKPDLVVSTVTAPGSALQGATISIADTTANNGKKKAKASVTRFSLSVNATSDSGDLNLADRQVPELAKKKSSAGTTSVKLSASQAPGSYFVIACADATDKVKEKKEANNCKASGKLTVSKPTPPPPEAKPSVAVNDANTLAEDAAASPLNVRFNDTDPDGPVEKIASVTQPAHGAAAVISAGTQVSYQPDADYCNQPGGSSDDFTYKLTGGSTGTVAVTVTCVDDLPVANGDDATVLQESGVNIVSVLANDTDVDGGTKQIVSVNQPENGTVVITGGGSGLTYQPDTNYCNTGAVIPDPPDQFSYEITGGSSAVVDMTVSCIRSHPTISAISSSDPDINTCGVINNFNYPTLQITGTNFSSDAKVFFRFPDGTEYDLGNVTVSVDGTTITGAIAPDETRKTGQGVIRVVNIADAGYVDSAPIDFWPPGTICSGI